MTLKYNGHVTATGSIGKSGNVITATVKTRACLTKLLDNYL
jgi:hypothetical protein